METPTSTPTRLVEPAPSQGGARATNKTWIRGVGAAAELAADERAVTDDPDYATEEYDEEYFRWIVNNKRFRSFKLRMRWVDALVEPREGDRIVDLGCGAGVVAEHCAERGAAVHGVDLSPVAVKVARELNARFGDRVTFEVGDAGDLPGQAEASFDKAISADVTEHCGYEVMTKIFREAHRLLEPGGTYFIYTPNPHHWIELGKEYGPEVGPLKQEPAHTGLRTNRVICDALRACGFEIAKNPRSPSFIPGVSLIERAVNLLPGVSTLTNYRVIVLARKPA